MKANELRLGNYYMFQGMRHSCSYHDIANLAKEEQRGQDSSSSCYQPIPLTEEWLLKLGFTKNHIGIYLSNIIGLATIEWSYDKRVCWLDFEGTICGKEIQYVHQLQNLYFALTGEELTIK